MNCNDLKKYLDDYMDRSLPESLVKEFDKSIDDCPEIIDEIKLYKKYFKDLENLPLGFDPPKDILDKLTDILMKQSEEEGKTQISEKDNSKKKDKSREKKTKKRQKKIKELSKKKSPKNFTTEQPKIRNPYKVFIIPFFLVLILVSYYYMYVYNSTAPWEILNKSGTVNINKSQNLDSGLYEEDVISTTKTSDVTVLLSDIGRIILGPSSKMEVLETKKTNNTVKLIDGALSFNAISPSSNFRVEYASVIIKDLYSNFLLTSVSHNDLLVEVTRGNVELLLENDRILIPQNYTCSVLSGIYISTPHHKSSSDNFINNLGRFDENNNDYDALTKLLFAASNKDVASLFRVLWKVPKTYREMVVKKIENFYPLPNNISEQNILDLDESSLNEWWMEIHRQF